MKKRSEDKPVIGPNDSGQKPMDKIEDTYPKIINKSFIHKKTQIQHWKIEGTFNWNF